jgi:hypothetical protein
MTTSKTPGLSTLATTNGLSRITSSWCTPTPPTPSPSAIRTLVGTGGATLVATMCCNQECRCPSLRPSWTASWGNKSPVCGWIVTSLLLSAHRLFSASCSHEIILNHFIVGIVSTRLTVGWRSGSQKANRTKLIIEQSILRDLSWQPLTIDRKGFDQVRGVLVS